MQTVIKKCVMSAVLVLAESAMALTCGKCGGFVLATDSFCQKCGEDVVVPPLVLPPSPPQPKPVSQSYTNRSYEQPRTSPSTDLPFYQGMGRGLVTVCCSPIECVRFSCVTFEAAADSWLKQIGGSDGAAYLAIGVLAVGAAVGTISSVGDVSVGTLDFLTFGTVGDAVWKDRKKSPYFWRRRWGRGDVGGAIF